MLYVLMHELFKLLEYEYIIAIQNTFSKEKITNCYDIPYITISNVIEKLCVA